MPIIYDPPGYDGGTLTDLVDEVTSYLQGFTAALPQVTSLSADLTSIATTVEVENIDVVQQGILEIGDELVYVARTDPVAGTVTLLPKGRGWSGTPATSHEAGETVTWAPAFPRSVVARTINQQLRALWPGLFAVGYEQLTITEQKFGWEIPSEADVLLDVRWKDFDGEWRRAHQWEVERSVPVADFPSEVLLNIAGVPVGMDVQILYGTKPQELASSGSTFSSAGLPLEARDLLLWGTLARLLPATDVSRLSVVAAPADGLEQSRPQGAGISIAKEFQKLYTDRLAELQMDLKKKYPSRIHWTR